MTPQDNPFPGMNPWLEKHWSDVHTVLLGYLRDAISPELPPDLNARAEERVAFETTQSEEITERWIEISNLTGKVISIIEILSPSNKRPPGLHDYQRRMRDCLDAGVNIVEIDLLRGGRHAVQVPEEGLDSVEGTHGIICVTRAARRRRHEVYRWPLRERIPAIRIPLRASDPDIPLDLQPLVDRAHKMGRYWQSTGHEELRPPLPKNEAAWAAEILKQSAVAH
jgi:hypothetical protein